MCAYNPVIYRRKYLLLIFKSHYVQKSPELKVFVFQFFAQASNLFLAVGQTAQKKIIIILNLQKIPQKTKKPPTWSFTDDGSK